VSLISYVASNGVNSTGFTVSPVAIGDVVVGTAFDVASADGITLGSGVSQPTPGGLIESVYADGDDLTPTPRGIYGIMGYRVAVDTAPTFSGWTGAQRLVAAAYHGVNTSSPILAVNWTLGNGNPVSYGALAHNDSKAWVIATYSSTNDQPAAPTLISNLRNGAARRYIWDSGAAMANYAGESIAAALTPGNWITCTIAIRSL
jgi:hypothetical protein